MIIKQKVGDNLLSEVLRLLRISQDLSIKDFAEKTGISASYISEIERGAKKPTLEMINKYSKAIGVSTSTILFFEEESKKNQYGYKELLIEILNSMTSDNINQK